MTTEGQPISEMPDLETRLREAQKEIERLRRDPSETLSEHPGCVYCMEAGTPVKDGEVCPKCGDRLPTKLERKQSARIAELELKLGKGDT